MPRLQDVERYVTSELDFTREAANSRLASTALAHWKSVVIPDVVACTGRVLVTEFMQVDDC